ncbi:MAG: hypothetical protein H6817_02815 [Phycisphaerales bacterium]|nr:hypothetical protein [Phycisphaerales bacterium]
MGTSRPTDMDLLRIAKRQRLLLWCILIQVLSLCVMPYGLGVYAPMKSGIGVAIAFQSLRFGIQICVAIVVVMLMAALKRNIIWRILYIFLVLVPFLNLLLLVTINAQATCALRDAGIRVGFMGADLEVVRRRMYAHLCNQCGYDLTGNQSGICPECGTAIGPWYCHHCGANIRGNFSPACASCGATIVRSV